MGFCSSSQSTEAPPVWADPLGPSSLGKGGVAQYGTSGAPQIRKQLFNYMRGISPQMTDSSQALASGLKSASESSFYPQAQKFAADTMGGKFLSGSPQLDRAMAANTSGALSAAADQDARIKSQFAKSGMGFSTAFQGASQANRAAAAADAARTNAATYLQNYMAERQNQQNAPAAFQAAQSAPLNYLAQIPGSLMAPLAQQGNMLTSLSSGGQVITPKVTETVNPSTASSIMNALGGLGGAGGGLGMAAMAGM